MVRAHQIKPLRFPLIWALWLAVGFLTQAITIFNLWLEQHLVTPL
jgi:hypothetical protein